MWSWIYYLLKEPSSDNLEWVISIAIRTQLDVTSLMIPMTFTFHWPYNRPALGFYLHFAAGQITIKPSWFTGAVISWFLFLISTAPIMTKKDLWIYYLYFLWSYILSLDGFIFNALIIPRPLILWLPCPVMADLWAVNHSFYKLIISHHLYKPSLFHLHRNLLLVIYL